MNWEPARADHSIDRATASITLSAPIDANAFDELLVEGRKVAAARHLTNRIELPDFPMPTGPIQAQGMVIGIGVAPPARRVVFRRLEAGGVSVEELALGIQQIMFATTQYRRWVDLIQFFRSVVGALDPIAAFTGTAKIVRLEYLDRFQSAPGGADHFEVLSRDSDFLTGAVTHKTHAFHVHCGWFDYETTSIRKLTNVNIDVNDMATAPPDDPRRTMSVLSLAQFEAVEGVLVDPLGRLEELHDYLKATFGRIITKDAAARVALND